MLLEHTFHVTTKIILFTCGDPTPGVNHHKAEIFSLSRVDSNICEVLLELNGAQLSGGGPGNVPSNKG